MGEVMRIRDDLRKCVVFIGFPESNNGFTAIGTGFLVAYEGSMYLVTNQHITVKLEDIPFAIRVNRRDGGSDNILVDPLVHGIKWYQDQAENIDLAVLPFNYDLWTHGSDVKLLSQEFFADIGKLPENQFGVGDQCYVVGLFRLMAGKTRNLPMVHSGNIALMPGQEKIPVNDWMSQGYPPRTREVDGYLVEVTSLEGLSGSPVFVRPAHDWNGPGTPDGGSVPTRLARDDVLLLGIWQGSWDARADDVMAVERGRDVRVPVGIGIVVPANKLVDLLDIEDLRGQRAANNLRISREESPGSAGADPSSTTNSPA